MKRAGMTLLTGVFGLLAPSPSATADVNVSTYLNDNARTGQNLAETVLTPTQVASGAFGLRFFHTVDGYVYAQPLYVSHVNMPGKGVHNVVFVATEHDTVYAFDADSNQGTNAAPLWQVSLLGTGETSVPYPDTLTDDIVSEVGITGTPVIDVASQTLYVVSKSRHVAGGGAKTYFQRLHALSLGTGQEKLGGPVDVDATITVPGNGDGSVSGQVPFDVLKEGQRCGLVLSKGIVYVSWASHGDNGPYHGWVIGFKASDIRQRAGLYNSTPDGGLGGIWQAGAAPAVDSQGFLYFATGNGTFSVDSGGQDYGDSLVKLNTTGGLTLDDYFTPLNQDALNSADQDFGSGGVTILPDQGAPARTCMVCQFRHDPLGRATACRYFMHGVAGLAVGGRICHVVHHGGRNPREVVRLPHVPKHPNAL